MGRGRRGGAGARAAPVSSHKKACSHEGIHGAPRRSRGSGADRGGPGSEARGARSEWERARRDPPRRRCFGGRKSRGREPSFPRRSSRRAPRRRRTAASSASFVHHSGAALPPGKGSRAGDGRRRGRGRGVQGGDEARRTATSRASRRESRTRPRAAEWASGSSLGSTAATGGAADRWMESADPRRTVRSPNVVQVRAKSSNPVRHSPSRLAPRSRSSGMTEVEAPAETLPTERVLRVVSSNAVKAAYKDLADTFEASFSQITETAVALEESGRNSDEVRGLRRRASRVAPPRSARARLSSAPVDAHARSRVARAIIVRPRPPRDPQIRARPSAPDASPPSAPDSPAPPSPPTRPPPPSSSRRTSSLSSRRARATTSAARTSTPWTGGTSARPRAPISRRVWTPPRTRNSCRGASRRAPRTRTSTPPPTPPARRSATRSPRPAAATPARPTTARTRT